MALSAVLVADLFTGFSATVWTAWLFFFVVIGIIVQWVFTVCFPRITSILSLTTYLKGYLFANFTRLRRNPPIWKQLLPLPLGLLLAVPAYHGAHLARSSLYCECLVIRIQPRRHRNLPAAPEKLPRPRSLFILPTKPTSASAGYGRAAKSIDIFTPELCRR